MESFQLEVWFETHKAVEFSFAKVAVALFKRSSSSTLHLDTWYHLLGIS